MSPISSLRALLRDASVIVVDRINRRSRRNRTAGTGGHICVFSGMPNPGLGDLVRKNHFYWVIRQARPAATLTVFESHYIVERFDAFFAHHAHVDEVVRWPDPGKIRWPARWWRLWQLRRRRFDICIIEPLSTSFRPLDAVLAGIPEIVALRHAHWSPQEARVVNRLLTPPETSEPDLFQMAQTLSRALGNSTAVTRAAFPPRFRVHPDDDNRLDPDRQYIAVHPGGEKRWPRRWPREAYVDLCLHLSQLPKCTIVIVGGAEEHEAAASMQAQVCAANPAGHVLNRCGGSLNDLANILDQCRMFVGNDSGPLHVAGALGTQAVAILGPSQQIDPIVRPVYKNYRAVIANCHCVVPGNHEEFACDSYCESETATGPVRYPQCLASVTVEQVIAAVNTLLAEADDSVSTSG